MANGSNLLGSILQGSQIRGQLDDRGRQGQINALQQSLAGQAQQGGFNPTNSLELQQLTALDPAGASNILSTFNSLDNSRQKAIFQDARKARQLLEDGDSNGFLNIVSDRLENIERLGGDPSGTMSVLQSFNAGDIQGTIAQLKRTEQAGIDGEFLKDITPKKQAFQKGDKGLVFDPSTGSFTIDPVAKARFDEVAANAVNKGGLDFKDRQGLNKDVTGIIKDTISIRKAASELDKLKDRGTAASKLGAVFKFMKSLDPTSVVRESEQGQVYSAQGAGAQLAGQINGLLGKGKLTEAGFLDLVNTAKTIADANITATSTQVGALLDTFEDTIPQSFKVKVSERVPKLFNIDTTTTDPVPQSAVSQGFTSPSGIQFTVGG